MKIICVAASKCDDRVMGHIYAMVDGNRMMGYIVRDGVRQEWIAKTNGFISAAESAQITAKLMELNERENQKGAP